MFKMPKKTLSLPCGLIILVSAYIATANAQEVQKLTDKTAILSIIGEAENQGLEGMTAVGCAIRNRVTLKGVFGYERARKQKNRPKWVDAQAEQAWKLSGDKDLCYELIGGATHWENVNAFGKPAWANRMIETAVINDHHFYRERGSK